MYYYLRTPAETHPTHELTKFKIGYACRWCGAYAKSKRITLICPSNEVKLAKYLAEEKAPNRSPKHG